jgi:translation initiation factor 2 subunit 2
MLPPYETMLDDLYRKLRSTSSASTRQRLELPSPEVIWVGNKTIFKNYSQYPRLLRRDPNKLLMYLAKELATAASLDGERAIFIGRKSPASFSALLDRYLREAVLCPACGNPDTRVEKMKRLQRLVCEACGARSPIKG